MNKAICFGVCMLMIITALSGCNKQEISSVNKPSPSETVMLPAPELSGSVSLEETLFKRRSVREYMDEPLSLEVVGQLLWAGQGITESWGGRTAPSAGGLYPLELYLAANNVTDLAAGVYKYQPEGHRLIEVKAGNVRADIAAAALDQEWVKEGAIVIVIAAVYERTTQKYGNRGIQYVHMEAGHAAQNICLQAAALNVGVVTVGAFNDNRVKNVLGIADNETPLYVIPSGKMINN